MRLFLLVFCVISFKSYADPDTVLSKFVFFDNNGKVSHAGDFKWYRLKALNKEGELYPFTGYYPGGQLYVYGFYSSLDSGGIKNGYFLYYDSSSGGIESEGLFLNNKQEGEWKYYYSNSEQLWYKVTYRDSEPQHLTSYYRDGQLKREENLNDEHAADNKCFDSSGNRIQFTPFFESPQFPGGNNLVAYFLSKHLQYPDYCMNEGIQGRVLLRFDVDEMGEILEVRVLESVHPLLDRAAAEAILRMPNWKPGLMDDKPTKTYFTLPVNFRIE